MLVARDGNSRERNVSTESSRSTPLTRAEDRSLRGPDRDVGLGRAVGQVRIDIVTLFPRLVEGPISESVLGRARERGLLDLRVVNLRHYAAGQHRVTDDYQFGGGGGMLLKPEPLFAAVEAIRTEQARVVLLDPRGRPFTQAIAQELSTVAHLILLAGRYEGVDERVSTALIDDALSIGDYVLTGGELPALVVMDAVARFVPGVLGDAQGPHQDSFARGLLEEPQYTRPAEFRGMPVPAVLLSGDHARIARWRRAHALWRTWHRRPDLIETAELTPADQDLIEAFKQGKGPDEV